MSTELTTHYENLIGLDNNWQVDDVDLSLNDNKVTLSLSHKSGLEVICPKCQKSCSIADHAPERTWRHLDTMQFQTVLVAKTPRSNCKTCGVLTIEIPWACKGSRFTLFFESFAVSVLRACSDIKAAAQLLNIDWSTANTIMKRAVDRGLKRRSLEEIPYVGIDEKSYQRRHNYATVINDIDNGRVIEVVKGRDKKAVDTAFNSLSTETKSGIKAIAMDMWKAYIKGAQEHLPDAAIVHDKFHISKYLNDAVNKVRKKEHKELLKTGSSPLTGSRQLFLFNPENMDDVKTKKLNDLINLDLKISRAWAIKENFRWFWTYTYSTSAMKFYKKWYYWATHSKLRPIKAVAQVINNHIENIASYFKHPITNAVGEGLNSKIQSLKTAARGFRNFDSYRTRILFFCGGLNMKVYGSTH